MLLNTLQVLERKSSVFVGFCYAQPNLRVFYLSEFNHLLTVILIDCGLLFVLILIH
jgi:hypothetical protein